MSIPSLTPQELGCLQSLAAGEPASSPLCPSRAVGRLIDLGLVEPLPSVWLPLEMHQSGYRLTSSGRAVLAGISAG